MSDNVKNLVIVESPSKAKTIGKYLGNDYVVKACMGHLRDLPKSTMGVDIANDFEPEYQPLKGKEDSISSLKKTAKASDYVYLATDPDREGEAISWHLVSLLDLPEEKTHRVTFNEITKGVVTNAIEQPRAIDQDLVDAQQARRILDRIVGYQLSPFLWKKVRKGLSAGRVQSVATRLVVDRENEIRAFVPQEYWTLTVELHRQGKPGVLSAQFYGDPKKKQLTCEEDVLKVLQEIKGLPFIVTEIKKSEKKRSPAPPFITSTLQQEASRKLNMTPRRTMAVAQQLYEGIDIKGEGTVGLITYMRTDSLRISEEALASAGSFIVSRYGEKFYNGSPRRFKTKGSAQDAHEAIRPSNVHLDPESIKSDLNKDQYRLYKLIWSRYVASQMANALYDAVAVEISCGKNVFKASHQNLKFSGFIAVYEEGRDEEKEEQFVTIPDLSMDEQLSCENTQQQQHFTQPPARYTEATLVRAMEEKGVGRPSTYAAIVATIQDKEYVLKKEKHLCPTPLGEVVNDLMMDWFQDVISVEFTAGMEEKLDMVESGKAEWKQVLRDFYEGFHGEMDTAEKGLEGKRFKVPDEETDEVCELCGRKMVIKVGRFGKFMACPGYPECTNTKPLVERMPGRCPGCGSTILKRKSKNGFAYYACEKGKECPWRGTALDGNELIGFMTWDVPTAEDCPVCGETMFKKSGKGRMKPFCINPECRNFLPEDQRGYQKKTAADEKKPAAKKTSAKKSAAKKTTRKKTAKKEAGNE